MKRKLVEAQAFSGRKLEVYTYGPDFEIEIDGKHYGLFLSPAAAINSAQTYITKENEDRKKGKRK